MLTLKKIFNLLTYEEKKNYLIITFFLLFNTFLEMISIAIIIPIFNVIFFKKIPDIAMLNYLNEVNLFNNSTPVIILILTIFCYSIKNFFSILYNYITINFFYKFNYRITNKIINIFLNQNYAFYLSKKSENILVKTFANTQGLKNYLVSLQIILTEFFFLLGLIIFLLYINFKIFLYLNLVFFIVFFIYLKIFRKKIKTWSQISNENLSRANNLLVEGIRGIKDVIIYKLNNFFLVKFDKFVASINNSNSKLEFLNTVVKYWIEIVVVFIICSSLIFVIIFENSIDQYLPIFTLFAVAVFRMVPTVNRLLANYQTLKFNKLGANEVCDVFSSSPFFEIKNSNKIYSFSSSIKFYNVSYAYNETQQIKIINNINFEILKNEKVCIVGENGSGKSTLLNLISGLLLPTSGKIYIDEVNCLDGNDVNWFKNISYVQQDVFLLNDTVKNNIIFSNDLKYDDNKFSNIVDQLKLENIFNNLSEGLNTKVGESGSKLSGGQKQMISLARAIYKNSDILIFDEPTSALDANYISVFKNLFSKLKDKTIIVVTHEQSLDYNHFDKVFKIKNQQMELLYVKK
jgi:ABC-type multidrug transport system fused ATPase/permease subunit